MAKIELQSENVVAETLLIALYARALEAQQPAPLIRDDTAVALVERIDYDFAASKLSRLDQVTVIMRVREFDRRTRDFLGRHPEAVVVHIGCGLDTRFERVRCQQPDNGQVAWYDLDLPEVIALRRQLIAEGDRRRYLGCSVFDSSWLADVSVHAFRPFLFLAEGVLPCFEEDQVQGLFLTLAARFPGAELVCDAMTPFMIRLHNLELRVLRVGARLRWGLRHGRDPESWGDASGAGIGSSTAVCIRLLDEWFYFGRPEPRLGATYLMRYLPPLAKGVGIYHYQLGDAEGRG